MAIPYSSAASLPQGLESVTINLISYIVDSIDMSATDHRIISRTDENGDRADFMVREGSGQITGSMTLQRATSTTVLPPAGTEFTYDFDRSGTASTLIVHSIKVNRSKDDFDTFDVQCILKTYQG